MGVMDQLKQSVHPECIGIALFVHEFVGFSWMFGAWGFMYVLNPTASLIQRFERLNVYHQKAEQWTNRKMGRMPGFIRNSKRLNVPRMMTSGIESYCLRNILRPVTIPSKIAIAVYAAKLYSDRKYQNALMEQK